MVSTRFRRTASTGLVITGQRLHIKSATRWFAVYRHPDEGRMICQATSASWILQVLYNRFDSEKLSFSSAAFQHACVLGHRQQRYKNSGMVLPVTCCPVVVVRSSVVLQIFTTDGTMFLVSFRFDSEENQTIIATVLIVP